MFYLLKLFWDWSGITAEEYAEGGMKQKNGEFEDEFPFFEKMILYANNIINNNILDETSIDDVITIMSLDNESESILEHIVSNSSDEQLQMIVERGIKHSHFNARWQIAELVFKKKLNGYQDYLKKLSMDKNTYVRKRALNCIERIATDEI